MASIEEGNLKIVNVTKTLATGEEQDFKFSVPPGGVGLMKESTYHLKRASQLSGYVTLTSEDIIIKKLEVMKQGASERTNLLSGNPNIHEFAGPGMLAKLFTVIETLENNEDVIVTVYNQDTVSVRVSLTLWFAIKPRRREIAGQGAAPEREA